MGVLPLLLWLCCGTASASSGFQPVSPEELKMTSEPAAPGAPAIILYRQVDRDDNGLAEDNYLRIKVLTEEGRKYANVEIPFFKGGANIKNLKARTIKPDGTVVNFNGTVFEKTIVKVRGYKYQAKTFSLPDVQVGSIIEYSYYIEMQGHSDSEWVLSQELFTKSAHFTLKPWHDVNLRWSSKLPPGVAAPKPEKIIHLEVNNIPAFAAEDYMPPAAELKYHVNFIYNGEPVNDPEAFWKEQGKLVFSRLNFAMSDHKAAAQAVAGIVSPDDAPEVKARKIYARLQQLRNTSFEREKTEQERKRSKDKEQHTLEDVWKTGYGTGDDITWLFFDLAKAAGLDAHPVLAASRSEKFFNPGLMIDSDLDSNMVLLHFADHDVFCDPGSAYAPYGLLPWVETGVQGMKLEKDGSTWIKTPVPAAALSHIERTAKLKLSEETGGLEGTLTVTYTGMEAYTRRVDERNEDDAAKKKLLEDEARESIPGTAEVELSNSPDWKSSEKPLVVEFKLKIPEWTVPAGRRTMLPVGFFSAPEKHLFEHATRVNPVYYHYPSTKIDDVSIELPQGWKAESLPQPVDVNQTVVAVAFHASLENGTLHLQRKLVSDIVFLRAEYYNDLRNFYGIVRTGDEQQVVLLPSAVTN